MHTEKQIARLNRYYEIAKNSFWFYPFEKICFICDKPIAINKDAETRLHSLNSPSIEFIDGWKLYHIHGVEVPEYVVSQPEKITIKDIESEQNAEIRRIKIDRFGFDKYIKECGAIKIHSDNYGILWRKELQDDEPIVTVELINSTPEPDGELKHYFIRVPPNMETATEAVAWTFGKTAQEYAPMIET